MSNKIILDAGHGGHDGGASSGGLKEAKLTLKIAKQIRKKLKKYNIKVKMTRTSNKFLSLTQRANIANNWGADAFISVHINSGGGTGFESYIYNGGVSNKTKTLQSNVHSNIMQQIDVADRGKKSANFAVVRQTSMPAILTENLFVDGDNKLLKKKKIINQLADGHVAGIIKFFGLSDKKSSKPKKKKKKKKSSSKKKSSGNNTIKGIQKWIGTTADGIDGKNTQKALTKKLQSELNKQFNAGLAVDGIWGAKTRNAVVNVRKGAKGNLTRVLQSALYLAGYTSVGKPDGIDGKNTQKALGNFQRKNGLAVDYIAGKGTFAKLFG